MLFEGIRSAVNNGLSLIHYCWGLSRSQCIMGGETTCKWYKCFAFTQKESVFWHVRHDYIRVEQRVWRNGERAREETQRDKGTVDDTGNTPVLSRFTVSNTATMLVAWHSFVSKSCLVMVKVLAEVMRYKDDTWATDSSFGGTTTLNSWSLFMIIFSYRSLPVLVTREKSHIDIEPKALTPLRHGWCQQCHHPLCQNAGGCVMYVCINHML